MMLERTLPTSMLMATLALHLSSPIKWNEVTEAAQDFLRTLLCKILLDSSPLRLAVVNMTNFHASPVEVCQDGTFSGHFLWGDGSPASQSLQHEWRRLLELRLSFERPSVLVSKQVANRNCFAVVCQDCPDNALVRSPSHTPAVADLICAALSPFLGRT